MGRRGAGSQEGIGPVVPHRTSASTPSLGTQWHRAFLRHAQDREVVEPLREAALVEDMAAWTTLLTSVVVRSCEELGWPVAAKGHPLALLPQRGQEYLGIDVMAFDDSAKDAHSLKRWLAPLAVFELENSGRDDRVAYSLWKVLSVRAALHVVIAYRRSWEVAAALPNRLAADVLPGVRLSDELYGDEIVVVMGSRSDGESFPWGYFKFWRLDHGVRRFTKLG